MPTWGEAAEILTALGVLGNVIISYRTHKQTRDIAHALGVTEGRRLQSIEDAKGTD